MKKKKTAPKEQFTHASRRPSWISRLLAGVVGLVLLTAALSKAMDIVLFVRQIGAYGIISHHLLLGMSAWGLIVLEFSLGVALLLSYRPRLALSLTALLFLLFVGASGWAWFSGATEDCGCFGALLKRTPGEAMIEGLILMGVTVLALLGHPSGAPTKRRAKFWILAAASLTGLALPVFFAPDLSWLDRPPSRPDNTDIGHLQIEGQEHMDIRSGSYLLVLMDTDCRHCLETLPELNSLARADDLAMVIGLCVNEKEKRRNFMEEFQPGFPLERIEDDVFWRLLGDGDLPRIILLRDGRILGVWDKMPPHEGTVRKDLQGRK
ncbi:MAG: hypothetical protein GY849_00870 [Deltaproteobacteria bacterium]|nr:hypothetical protein [Deltaproteobacteria bacterium]